LQLFDSGDCCPAELIALDIYLHRGAERPTLIAGDPYLESTFALTAAATDGDPAVADLGKTIVSLPERQNVDVELRRLAAIVASSSDAIISTSLDGKITSWNRAAEAIFGYRPEEPIGRPVSLLAAPGREDEMPRILDRVKQGERIEHYETIGRCKEGHEINVSLTLSPSMTPTAGLSGSLKSHATSANVNRRRPSWRG